MGAMNTLAKSTAEQISCPDHPPPPHTGRKILYFFRLKVQTQVGGSKSHFVGREMILRAPE